METLTLELLDTTVGQAMMELQAVLRQNPATALYIVLGPDETIRHNLLRLLEKHGRQVESHRQGSTWHLEVSGTRTAVLPLPATSPSPCPKPSIKPVLVLRSAFTPGEPSLGRRLLLGVLQSLGSGTPWLGLAHQGIELLEDPMAMQVLAGCQDRGIPVRLSSESLLFMGGDPGPFEVMEDQEWQRLLGRGDLTLV